MKNLETEDLLIRKPKIEDSEIAYNNCFSKECIAQQLDFNPHSNLLETKIEIMSYIYSWDNDLPAWTIETKKREIIGYIRIKTASIKNKKCNILYYIFPQYEKQYTEQALRKIVKYLINEENYETIIFSFYDLHEKETENKIKLFDKLEAKLEGVLRNRKIHPITGEKRNLFVYSILKEEITY